MSKRDLTLPTDSQERKEHPLCRGVLRYFPAALAGVARISKIGNDKHNPGEPMYHARGKSTDHSDCILRHLMDLEDLLARRDRDSLLVGNDTILAEASSLAWRALALSQELHERFGAPLAPGAELPKAQQCPVVSEFAQRALADVEGGFKVINRKTESPL